PATTGIFVLSLLDALPILKGGNFIPDCGSMAKMIEASTGRFPEFFGKPSIHTLEYIIDITGCRSEEIAVVGDRLYTDIAVAAGRDRKRTRLNSSNVSNSYA